MLINWSSRDIDIFLALAETLSFRQTAERVHLSQPAVTAVIARMEAALEVKLFDRTTRQVQLTAGPCVCRTGPAPAAHGARRGACRARSGQSAGGAGVESPTAHREAETAKAHRG